MDVFFNFWENKTAPLASTVKNLINQRTFEGGRPTLFTEAKSLMTPIIGSTGKEALEARNKISDMLLAIIADGVGISVSNYVFQTNWETNTSKELAEFRDRVGLKEFREANKEYNRQVSEMYIELFGDVEYQKLSNEERQKEVTKRKSKIKKAIIK
jgi:hypothetical protein|tara:strand:+ start:1753 stop:2220 length:468 start_codon:yes stop_codon:yes gene_type:complete